jgi:hypothetical protein
MKTKTFKKKLGLNKNTIANLTFGQLGSIKGGHISTRFDCTCTVIETANNCPSKLFTDCICPTDLSCATCIGEFTCGGQVGCNQ